MKKSSTLAQGTTEYALILALVVLVVLVVLALFGKQIAAAYQKSMAGFRATQAAAGAPAATSAVPNAPTSTPDPRSIPTIAQDFMARTLAYRQNTGKWPPNSGDAYFTALGLNPDDYQGPVSGIMWVPDGKLIGLAAAENTRVYVTNTDGTKLQLYDGWNVWCHADNGKCYYHDKGVANEVILSTITVTGN